MDTAEGMKTGSEVVTGYTDMEGQHILEILDRKRKSLDNEIARFRAQKEEEYRLFERTLRDIIEKSVKKDQPKTRGIGAGGNEVDRPAASRNMFEGPASMQEVNSGYQIYRGNTRRSELSRSLQEASTSGLRPIQNDVPTGVVKDKSENIALRQVSYDSPGQMRGSTFDKNPVSSSRKSSSRLLRQDSLIEERRLNPKDHRPTHHYHPENQSLTHERDLEFRGLFTPHFLPLLDCSDRSAETTNSNIDPHAVRRNHDSLIDAPLDYLRHTAPQITPLTSRTLTKPERLSLPTHTTSITNPPRLSSSIPARPPSSASATLHSSLRSPTSKKPRSPKRVHFQIDNVVLPPSSTPPPAKTHPPPIVYAMPWPTKETSPAAEPAAAAKASKVGVAEAKKEGASEVRERQMSRELAASAPASTSASTRGKPAKDASATPAAAPAPAPATKAPAASHQDDDDDGDDVFLLDEEIAAKKDVWTPSLLAQGIIIPTDSLMRHHSLTDSSP